MPNGLLTITVEEERGQVATSANIDQLAVVMGCSSAGSGMSNFFLSSASAIASLGYGDAVDTTTQIIEQPSGSGAATEKRPCALYTLPVDTAGYYGAINVSGVTGTALPTVDSGAPLGTYEPTILIDNGGTIGTSGITYKRSYDKGRRWSNTISLGTATTISLPNSGTGFILNPAAGALVAIATEIRADLLAHFANAVAHNLADATAAALITLGVPTTNVEAYAVLNECRAALVSHLANDTAHDSKDLANGPSAPAATSEQTGVALAIDLKAKINLHLAATYPASAASILIATATTVAPQVYTDATLIAAGVAQLNGYPSYITFTTAGGTPADSPADVTIAGTNADTGLADTEVVTLGQIAGTDTSTKRWLGTGLTITYAAGDGTDATISIGTTAAAHNSADVTNTIATADPSPGTLNAGDTWTVRTFGPEPGTSDIASAFTAIAASTVDFGILILDFTMTAALVPTITTGLNALLAVGKRVTAIGRVRLPDFEASEGDAAWLTSVSAEYINSTESRLELVAAYGLVTDAVTSRSYMRSELQQCAADIVRVGRAEYPGAPADRSFGIANFSLVDDTGATIGHDEGPRGLATGLSSTDLGNRFGSVQRFADPPRRESVFNTVHWVLFAGDEKIRTLMARRVANAMERVIVTTGIGSLGSKIFYQLSDPNDPASAKVLTPTSRKAIHGVIYNAVKAEFRDDIQNPEDAAIDTGLIQVNPVVTVDSGGLVTVEVRAAPRMFGYLVNLSVKFSVQE